MRVRSIATAAVCVAGLACAGYLRAHYNRPTPQVAAVPVAPDTARAQAPKEWLPFLAQSGLFDPARSPSIDAAQEKSLLAAETYCARFGEYPERANFSSGWSYSKSGLEMSLRGPVGEYDSLVGWRGGPEAAPALPEASSDRLHFCLSRPQVEQWLAVQGGLRLSFTESLKSVVVDYHVGTRQGKLRFAGVAASLPQDKLPEDLWTSLPATSQRAIFRPELLLSLWGAGWSRLGGMWTQFLLSRQDEWVGFGVDSPLDIRALRPQLNLLAGGKLPAFCMFGASNTSISVPSGRTSDCLEITRTESGKFLFSLGLTPRDSGGGGGTAAQKGQSGGDPDKADLLAMGSSVLALSEREQMTVEWKARCENGELVVDFATQPVSRISQTLPTGHPDLESQHRTKTSVVAGK